MGLIWRLFKFGITVFLILLFLRSYGLKWGLSLYLQSRLGTEVSIGEARVDFVNAQAKISEIVIRNPLVFPEGDMILISQAFLQWKPSALLTGQFLITLLDMEIREIRAVRMPGNGFNLYGLKIFREGKDKGSTGLKGPRLNIEKLILSMKRGSFTDETAGTPLKKEYELGVIRAAYTDIQGIDGLGKVILAETVKKMGIAAVLDLIS